MLFLLVSCHKQIAGPRKLTCKGYVEYSFVTGNVAKVIYSLTNDDRIFKIKINKDYTISGDVVGEWAHSGAQILMYIDGDFGPDSPFDVSYGYYSENDEVLINNIGVNIRDFADEMYFVTYTAGNIGTNQYIRLFIFE